MHHKAISKTRPRDGCGMSKLFLILDKVFIREYDIPSRHAINLKNILEESCKFINILNSDGRFKKSIINPFIDGKLTENSEEEKEPEESKSDNYQGKKENSDYNFSLDMFNLIKFFASRLPKQNMELEEVSKLIENNTHLTHTQLVFKVVKKDIESEDISDENIEVVFNALQKDLGIV